MKNFLNRIFNGVRMKTISFLQAPLSQFNGQENWFDSLNLSAFKDSLYLFIGVSMIRESVSSIPLELYRIKNTDGDVEEVFDDPTLDLIERPNAKQTQKEFMKLAVSYYLLAGETFVYLERPDLSSNTIPTAMANMRPDQIEIVFSADKKEIVAYEFMQLNGTTLKLPPEAVLHIKNIDPVNPARGIGVVRPATQRIITEKEASEYQAQTFKNQGRPDIAIFTDADLTDEDAQDARDRWNKIYGKERGSAAGFFGSSVKDLKILNVTPKEMDFLNSQQWLRDDILAALRVPKAMVTSDDVNLANSKTARTNYIKEAVMPTLDAILDIINHKMLHDADQDLFLSYESPVNEDRELVLKEAVELKKAQIITVNEARAIMDYPEVEDGDVREAGTSLFQMSIKEKRLKKLARNILKKRPALVKKFAAVTAVTKMIEAEKNLNKVKRGRASVFSTPEMKEKYIKSFNANIDNKSDLFADTVNVYNQDFLQRIIKHMTDFGINKGNFFDFNVEVVEAKAIFEPMMKSLFAKVGEETMQSIASGFAMKASEQFLTTDEIIRQLEARAEFFIISMLDTDFKQMQGIIAAGLEEGHGVAEIGRSLRDYFEDMSVSRARTIARTETGRLISLATNEAYQQSAVVTGKEWLTARDSKVRDEHAINDGVIVETNGTFPNGEQYPGQYTINCRCALAPAV